MSADEPSSCSPHPRARRRSPGARARPRFARLLRAALPLALGAATLAAPQTSEAFCGFYVAGADAELFNNATVVVLMRQGKRTVLSMQNDYQGPPEAFALVIPVPVVLGEDEVKTLRPELFERVETLSAPRLVEYWEQDPCKPFDAYGVGGLGLIGAGRGGGGMSAGILGVQTGVSVEAQFAVGEYEIVILSAKESNGLDTWLRANDYNIPAGAEPLLRPYVEQGMKFFVAKVDPRKVKFDEQGRARLSPLRFHYDSDEFSLPIRLGLINAPGGDSGGKQDLLVHILAPNQRYQAANYPNVQIPTNLEVKDRVREQFGAFYVSLFDHTLEQEPGAVVTEYAWGSNQCDPCPGPDAALTPQELAELGADVVSGGPAGGGIPTPQVSVRPVTRQGELDKEIIRRIARAHVNELRSCYAAGLVKDPKLAGEVTITFVITGTGKVVTSVVQDSKLSEEVVGKCMAKAVKRWKFPKPRGGGDVLVSAPFQLTPGAPGWVPGGFGGPSSNFVLTRLHARYDASSLGEDLVFEVAEPLVGGREFDLDGSGVGIGLGGLGGGSPNNFQGRYIIRHAWEGEIECEEPQRGIWGGPWPELEEQRADANQPVVARRLASAARGGSLGSFITASAREQLGVAPVADEPAPEPEQPAAPEADRERPEPSATAEAKPEQPQAGCACATGDPQPLGAWLGLGSILALLGLRRRDAL